MDRRPRILSISFSDFRQDARVLRQLAVLSEYGDVTTLGYGSHSDDVAEHLEIPSELPSLPQTLLGVALLATRRFRAVELRAPAIAIARKLVTGRSFDLIVANEARALPLAHAIANGAQVWGDMHEWAPEERVHVPSWRLLIGPYMRWVCATYLPRTAVVTTVNRSIADLYDAQFGTRSLVVRNARPYSELSPSTARRGAIRLAHSGAAVPGREIETLIRATLQLGDKYTLDLLLLPARDEGNYLSVLKSLAGGSPRITFRDAVPPESLPAALNDYDIGVFVLPPKTTNHRLMLPNKFFDFVQARLAIVFSPAPETDQLINQYDLGVVTADFSVDSLVTAVASLDVEDIERYKRNAHAAASALSSREDIDVQRTLVEKLLALQR